MIIFNFQYYIWVTPFIEHLFVDDNKGFIIWQNFHFGEEKLQRTLIMSENNNSQIISNVSISHKSKCKTQLGVKTIWLDF